MFALHMNIPGFPTSTIFDIVVEKRNDVRFLNGTKVKNAEYLQLKPCTQKHWEVSGLTDIENKFEQLDLGKFLCPALDYNLTL